MQIKCVYHISLFNKSLKSVLICRFNLLNSQYVSFRYNSLQNFSLYSPRFDTLYSLMCIVLNLEPRLVELILLQSVSIQNTTLYVFLQSVSFRIRRYMYSFSLYHSEYNAICIPLVCIIQNTTLYVFLQSVSFRIRRYMYSFSLYHSEYDAICIPLVCICLSKYNSSWPSASLHEN